MSDQDIGLTEAISEAQQLRRRTGAKDLVIHWTTAHGEVALIVDSDGHDVFVDGESVPGRGPVPRTAVA